MRWLRRLGAALVALLLVAVLGYAVIYAMSEYTLRRTYPVPRVTLSVPTDADSIREGERLATLRGCMNGCHGKRGEGAVMFDMPMIARIVAPNLTAAVRRLSDEQLVGVIRYGIKPDGRSAIVMPAQAFGLMNDADLGRTIAFLKTLPPADGPAGQVTLGPLGRIGIALGELHDVRQEIEAALPPPAGADAQAETGRYLARSICGECHGTGLRGDSNPDFTSPNLRIVLAYSPDAFTDLMRNGKALGGRELKVMSGIARAHLSRLTDDEIAALYAYLHDVVP
jgi:cytochrome c553